MYDLDSERREIDEYWDRDAYDDFIASLDMNDLKQNRRASIAAGSPENKNELLKKIN